MGKCWRSDCALDAVVTLVDGSELCLGHTFALRFYSGVLDAESQPDQAQLQAFSALVVAPAPVLVTPPDQQVAEATPSPGV